jgi:predicted TPR repeat methyltransferase
VTTDHFDEKAATWDDDPAKVERAQVVAQAIRAAIPLDPDTRLLEYGAGTGLVTQALRDAVGPVTMADTSAGMREVMDRKVADGAIPDARVWDLDLSAATAPDERFDLIVTVLTLHHITDLEPVLAAFANLLDDGGHLCIVDLEEEDGSFHTGEFGGHHGFAQTALTSLLERAGFREISFQRCHQIERDSGTYPLFLAIARV